MSIPVQVASAPPTQVAIVQSACQSQPSSAASISAADIAAVASILGKMRESIASQGAGTASRPDTAGVASVADMEDLGRRVKALEVRVEALNTRVTQHHQVLDKIVEKLAK
jgi:hypothetical protein